MNLLNDYKWLWVAVILSLGLSLIGSNWGKVEDWNPDQMALQSIPKNLMMGNYLKPPLDTYIHKIFVIAPLETVMKGVLHCSHRRWLEARLLGCRIFTSLLFCGSVILLYGCILRFVGKNAASILALLMATSAGLLEFNHYGTADSPLLFWMLASFACTLMAGATGKTIYAISAGLLAGLATADKYNGLGVALAIPVAFLLREGCGAFRNRNLWLAALAVPTGFVIGVPGVIFEHRQFVRDFLYNLYTTPVYAGDVSHPGYMKFLNCFPELVGWPCCVILLLSLPVTAWYFFTGKLSRESLLLAGASAAVLIFYFLTIGRFPRMEVRFALPAVPFAFLVAAPSIQKVPWKNPLLIFLIATLVFYNILCSWISGTRYIHDPRMSSVEWAEKHFLTTDIVESSYSPVWSNLIPGIKVIRMPTATGRSERFKHLLGNNPIVARELGKYEPDVSSDLFTQAGLHGRDPDYVTFSSQALYFSGPTEIQDYYRDHLQEKLGYHKVFESRSISPPKWIYPQQLDFLADWMVILKKKKP